MAIDVASRLAYTEVLSDERKETAARFLQRAVAFYARHGVRIQRLLTDNCSCYRSRHFARLCRSLQVRYSFTCPYRSSKPGSSWVEYAKLPFYALLA